MVQPTREEEIIILRRHSLFIVMPFFWVLLGLIIVGLIFFKFGASMVFSVLFFIWLIIGGGYIVVNWYKWYMTRYVFTNRRVIVREQASIFKKISAEIRLDEIADITYVIEGVWATLFNYGSVFVEAENREPLIIADIYRPGQIQEELFDIRDEILKGKKMTADEFVRNVQKSSDIRNKKNQAKARSKEDEE